MLTNISPNMLKTYESCPKKYYYQYVEKVNVPKSFQPFEKGKKIHALANYYLQGINISRIETALTEDERIIWNLLLNNPFYKKDCLKSEFYLSTKIGDFWVGGRLDAVVHDGDEYYILDYKTGSIPKNPEYDYQTMIYLLCLDRYLKSYKSLAFVYVNLKDKQNYIINFDEDIKTIYEQKVIKICTRLSSDNLYVPNTEDCKYCDFLKICSKASM